MGNYQSKRTARGHRRRRLVTLRRQMGARFRRVMRRGSFYLLRRMVEREVVGC